MNQSLDLKIGEQTVPSQEIFLMETETYSNQFALIKPGLAICYRHHQWPKSLDEEIDTFGPYWAIGTFPEPIENLWFRSNQGLHQAHQKVAAFIPPNSIFSTHIHQGSMGWLGYFSDLPLPPGLPQTPVLMPWSLQGITGNLETLFNEIRAQRDHWINIEKRQTGSRIALKSKIWIDQHFRGEDSFSDLSKWLGVDQSVLGREFKACYGVSPSVFRKKLRTTTAMLSLVLKGGNVTDVGTQVGYGDLDHFTKQFRANLLALPSQFKPPKEFYESVFRETNIVHEK